MKIKDIMKLYSVTERTVRRWNLNGCPYTKNNDGSYDYDPGKVAEWRKSQWTKEAQQ